MLPACQIKKILLSFYYVKNNGNYEEHRINMTDCYKILYRGGEGEIVEKKSRFIATTRPVETEEEAAALVEAMKKKYWDARHHCFAYVIGDRGQIQRCSDDGEPSQTAGRPMLDVLLGEGVRNACVVVTRYFGGTLLGTGGLVRAYSKAAQEGLRQSTILEKSLGSRIEIMTDYNGIGKIQYVAAQMGLTTLDTVYTDQVVVTLMAPKGQVQDLFHQVTEKTNGKAAIRETAVVYYGILDKEVVLFDH